MRLIFAETAIGTVRSVRQFVSRGGPTPPNRPAGGHARRGRFELRVPSSMATGASHTAPGVASFVSSSAAGAELVEAGPYLETYTSQNKHTHTHTLTHKRTNKRTRDTNCYIATAQSHTWTCHDVLVKREVLPLRSAY